MAIQTSFRTTTATNYKTLLDDVVTFATNEQLSTVAINAGGTGYVVGDILTLSGGTSIVAATMRVLTLSGSAVATLEVVNAGSYSVATGTTGIATTGGTGTGATVDVTYQTPWANQRKLTQQGLINVVIVAPGTSYTVSDTLTITGGTGTAATLNVDSVSGGVITGVSIVTSGEYTVLPTSPVSVTGGTGSGATFTATFDGVNSENQYLLEGIGSGSDNIYVGIRTYNDTGANAFNWELAGMTGHSLTSDWPAQPDITPGRYDASTGTIEGGSFVPLANSTITYWLNVTGRRILLVTKISTSYSSMYLGFIQPFGTVSELPYPLLVGGCVNQPDTRFSSTRQGYASVSFPTGKAQQVSVSDPGDLKNGPLMLRDGNGSWVTFCNSYEPSAASTTTSRYRFRNVSPPGGVFINTELPAENDSWIQTEANTLDWADFAEVSTADSVNAEFRVTPDTGGDLSPLIPQALLQAGNAAADVGEVVYGELDGFKYAPIFGTTLVAEDTVTIGNIVHRIFQSGTKTEPFHFFAMEER